MMKQYSGFTDSQLVRAVELMISKEDLKIREAAEALLATFGYSRDEIFDQLNSGEYLNNQEPLQLIHT